MKLYKYIAAFLLLPLIHLSAQDSFVIDNTHLYEEEVDNSNGSTIETHKIYEVKVSHNIPNSFNTFFALESETVNFIKGYAKISGENPRDEKLNTYPDLIFTGFSPQSLPVSGNAENNILNVSAAYSDSQNFVLDSSFSFDPPAQGEESPEPSPESLVVSSSFDSRKVYDIEVNHNLPQSSENFLSVENDIINFSEGQANISGEENRTVKLLSYPHLTLLAFNPAALTPQGSPEDNRFSVNADYKEVESFNIDSQYVFNAPAEGEETPEPQEAFQIVNGFSFNSFRIYDVEVTHDLPEVTNSFFALESESLAFANGRAEITGGTSRSESLSTFPALTLTSFSPANLTLNGTPDLNKFSVTASYKDIQAYNIAAGFSFDPPAEGEDPPEGTPISNTVNGFAFDSSKIYKINVTHNLPETVNSFLILETETAAFVNGSASINGPAARTETLNTYPELTYLGFNPANLTALGSPQNNIFDVTALYKDVQAYNITNTFVFNPPAEGEEPPEGGAFADAITSQGFINYKIYKAEVTHNLAGTKDDFLMLEYENAFFSPGQASIAGTYARTFSLKTYPQYTFNEFKPEKLTAVGTHDANVLKIDALYSTSDSEVFASAHVFDPPAEGEEAVNTDDPLIPSGAFNSHRIYQVDVLHNLTAAEDKFFVNETENISFVKGYANITGDESRSVPLKVFPSLTLDSFTPQTFDALGTPDLNRFLAVASYRDVQSYSFDSSFVFDPPAEGEEPPVNNDPGAAVLAGTFNSYKYYRLNYIYDAAQKTDTFMVEENTGVAALNDQLTLSGGFPDGSFDLSYPALNFTPNNFVIQDQANPQHVIDVKTDLQTFTITFTAGANGRISGKASQTIEMGGTAEPVVAVPDPSYAFIGWAQDGDTNPIKIPSDIQANATYTAQFEYRTHSVTFTAGANGSIIGDANQTVGYNLSASPVTALPDPGYILTGWDDNNTDLTREIKNVTEDLAFSAQFELNIPYLLSHQNGDRLGLGENLFTWTPVEDSSTYTLSFGTSAGASDIDQFSTGDTEASVNGLPNDGTVVYVRLQSNTSGVIAYSDYILDTGVLPFKGNLSLIYRGVADMASRMSGKIDVNMDSLFSSMISSSQTDAFEDEILTYYRETYVKTQPVFINKDFEGEQRAEDNFSLSGEFDAFINKNGSVVVDAIEYRQDDKYGVLAHPRVVANPSSPKMTYGTHSYNLPFVMWNDYHDIRGYSKNLGDPKKNDYIVSTYGTWTGASGSFSKSGDNLLYDTPYTYQTSNTRRLYYEVATITNPPGTYPETVLLLEDSYTYVTSFVLPMSDYEVEFTQLPSHGTVSSSSSHYITYTCTDEDFVGVDRFVYQLKLKDTGEVFKTITYKVKIKESNEEYLFDFNRPEMSPQGKKWGQAASGGFTNEVRNDSSRLKLNTSATYEYNGQGGTHINIPAGGTGPAFNGLNLAFQNGSNRKFAFETRIRFPENNPGGVVLMESKQDSRMFLKIDLLSNGKIKLTAKDLLKANGTLNVTSTHAVPSSGWIDISVIANLADGTVDFDINGNVSSFDSTNLSKIPLSASQQEFFKRYGSGTTPSMDIDYIRITTNKSGSYVNRKGENYFDDSNHEILVDGYNWLNKLQLTPEKYKSMTQADLNTARSDAKNFYHFHPTYYSAYHGMNEFKFAYDDSLELAEETKVTVFFRTDDSEDWKTLIVSDLSNSQLINDLRWVYIPWDTNKAQNEWTQTEIDGKDQFKKYQFKLEVSSDLLSDKDLEVEDLLNGSFKHVFSYDPVVTALEPDKEYSAVQLRFDRNSHDKVLRDFAIFNENDKIIDVVVRKKIEAPESFFSGFDTSNLFGASAGDKFADGTEVIFTGSLFFSGFPKILDAEELKGRYAYKTYTIFTDYADALTSNDPNVNTSIVEGNEFIYDSENNREGLEDVRSSQKDIFAPYQPVITANPGDGAVGLSWSYQDRQSGLSADIEVYRVDVEVFKDNKLIKTINLGNVRNTIVSGLENGNEYIFKVVSYDSYNNAISGSVTSTPIRTAVAVSDVSNFKTYVGLDTVALQWHYKPEDQSPVNPLAFLKWKNTSSNLTEGTIGFLIFRNQNGTDKLIAALPVDFSEPEKDYFFIDKGLQPDTSYTYKIISIDRANNRNNGLEETVSTLSQSLIEELTNIENSQYYSKTVFQSGDTSAAGWYGASKGSIPDHHLNASLPQNLSTENINSEEYLVIPSGAGGTQTFQNFIPENPAFSVGVKAQISGQNLNNSGITLLSFKNRDNETDPRFEGVSGVVRKLQIFEDHIEFNGSSYGFAHGGEVHTYAVNRFADDIQLIIDGQIVEETHKLKTIASEQGNSFIRFGADSTEENLSVKCSNITYAVGVAYYFGGQKQAFDVIPPQPVSNVIADVNTSSQVTLSWDAPADTDIKAYFVELDNYNGFSAWTRTNSLTLSLPDSLLFTGRVTAVDSSGNYSIVSEDIQFTVAPENILSAEVQDVNSSWAGWTGNRTNTAPWISFTNGSSMEKALVSDSSWSIELNLALNPGQFEFEDQSTVPVMEDNTVLSFVSGSKIWKLTFTADKLKYICQEGALTSESNVIDYVSGGKEHSLRIINKGTLQYIFIDGEFIGSTNGFEFSSVKVGNEDGAGLNVKSMKIVTSATAANEFLDLNSFSLLNSEPLVTVHESTSVREEGSLKLNLNSVSNANTLNIKLVEPRYSNFTSLENNVVYDIPAVPLSWIENGQEVTLPLLSLPLETLPLPYLISVKPVRRDAHAGLGDSHSYKFDYTEGNQVSGLIINSEDISSNIWNYKFASTTSQTISYPSFVIPHKTVTMGASETNSSSPGPDFYTVPLETTSFDFSAWLLNQGYEGTLIKLTGKDSQGNPRTVPIVYEAGKLWLYNEAVYTGLYSGQLNNIRVTWSGSVISVYLNNNPQPDLEASIDVTFTGAGSSLSFGLVNPIDEDITNHKLVWAEPKFTRNSQATPFISNDTVSTAWTYNGNNTHVVDEHEYFGVTSLRALGADKGLLQVNKSDLPLGDEWTAEFNGARTQGSAKAVFYTDDDRKISFDLASGSSVYRVVYSRGYYFVTRNGAHYASGEAEDHVPESVSFEIETTAANPASATSRGAFQLRSFKVVNNATDSLSASFEPLRGAFYAEETTYNTDGTANLNKGRMLFQPVYLSTAPNGLNWNFEHTSTVQPFVPVAGQSSSTPVTYDYSPGSYGVTISEAGDFTVGINNVSTTYLPELGPDLNKPRNLNISRTPTAITFSWNAPAGVKPNQYLVQLFDPVNGLLDFDPASLDAALTADSDNQISFDPLSAPDTFSVTYNIPLSSQNKKLQLQIASQFRKGDVLTSRSDFLTEEVEPYDSNSVTFDPLIKHLETFPEDRAVRLQVSFPPADLQGYLLWRSDPDSSNNPQAAYVDKVLVKLDENAIDLLDQLNAGYTALNIPGENILESLPVNSNYFFFHGDESSFSLKVNRVHNSSSENEKTYNFAIDPYDDQRPSDLTKPNLGSTESGAGEIVSSATVSNINVVSATGTALNLSPQIIDRRAQITLTDGSSLPKFSELSTAENIPSWIINNLDPDTLLVPSSQYLQDLRISGPAVADRSLSRVSLQVGSEVFSSVIRQHTDLEEDKLDVGAGFYYNPNDGMIYHNVDTTFTAAQYLRQGLNIIYLSAEDDDGAKAHAELGIINTNNEIETAAVILDNQAPTFSFIPGNTDDLGRSILTENFTVSGLYNDISGISNIEVLVDGQAVTLDSSNAKVSNGVFTIQLGNTIADGEHTVSVILTDLAGNVSDEKSYNVIFSSTHMAASITHSIDPFGNRQFYSDFTNVSLIDITKITMNGQELDASARQAFYDSTDLSPVTFQSMGYSGENDPGNHLVAFRITVQEDINGQIINRELTAAAEWYNNDDLPTVTSTVPSVNEMLFSSAGEVTLNNLIINVFDQDPGVEFDKIEILANAETGEKTDVKNKFDITNFAASLKEGESLELIPEEWTNGPAGDTKRAFIYLTLKEKETGVIVETKLTYFVLPDTYTGPVITSSSNAVIATGKHLTLLLKGKNLSEVNFVTLQNQLTGEKQTFPVNEVAGDTEEQSLELDVTTFNNGPFIVYISGNSQPQVPIIGLPVDNQEQAKIIENIVGDANNDGEINGHDLKNPDTEEFDQPETIVENAKEKIVQDPLKSHYGTFGIISTIYENSVGNNDIKIESPFIDESDNNTATLANGFINIKGQVPEHTYLVEVEIDNKKEVAALTRDSIGNVIFYGKNIFIDDFAEKGSLPVTVKAYINGSDTKSFTFNVKTGEAPQILGFYEGSPEIYAYKSIYKSLSVGNRLVKRGRIISGANEDSPQGLDGLISSKNPIDPSSLEIYIDNKKIDNLKNYWDFRSSSNETQLQLIFKDSKKINIYDINSNNLKTKLIDPWLVFESSHLMTVKVADIQGNTAIVYRNFTLNRGEPVKYDVTYKTSVSATQSIHNEMESYLRSAYLDYANKIHTYIRPEDKVKNLGTNRLLLTNLSMDPEDYGFTLNNLEELGLFSTKFPGYFGGGYPDQDFGKFDILQDLENLSSEEGAQSSHTPGNFYGIYFGASPFPGEEDPQSFADAMINGSNSGQISGSLRLNFFGEQARAGGAIEQLSILSENNTQNKWKIGVSHYQPDLADKTISYQRGTAPNKELWEMKIKAVLDDNPKEKDFDSLYDPSQDKFNGYGNNVGYSAGTYSFQIEYDHKIDDISTVTSTGDNVGTGSTGGGSGAGSGLSSGGTNGGNSTEGSGQEVTHVKRTASINPDEVIKLVGEVQKVSLNVQPGDIPPDVDKEGQTTLSGLLEVTNAEPGQTAFPSETDEGDHAINVKVLFPAILGSYAQPNIDSDRKGLHYLMRFNKTYKVYANGFVLSKTNDRPSLGPDNLKPLFMSTSSPYSYIGLDQTQASIRYNEADDEHFLSINAFILDPMTAYDLTSDPSALREVYVNSRAINTDGAFGEGIFMEKNTDGRPVFKVVLNSIKVRRGLNGIKIRTVNKYGVESKAYFTVKIDDLDDLLSTGNDLTVSSISQSGKIGNTSYPNIKTAHIFGEYLGDSGSVKMGSVSLEMAKSHKRFGRYHREFLIMNKDFLNSEVEQITDSQNITKPATSSSIVSAAPGEQFNISSGTQSIPVYVEGITLNKNNSPVSEIKISDFNYQLNAFIDSARHKDQNNPEFKIQVYSKFGVPQPMLNNETILTLQSDAQNSQLNWGPDDNKGWSLKAYFKVVESKSVYRVNTNTPAENPEIGVKAGELLVISIGGLKKIYKVVSESPEPGEYELVTGLTPSIGFTAPVKGMGLSAEVIMPTGLLKVSHSLLNVPGRKMNTSLGLTYRSNHKGNSDYLGTGWSASWENYFVETENGYLFHYGNGRRDLFEKSGDMLKVPAGYFQSAAISADKSTITLTSLSETVTTFERIGSYNSWKITSTEDRYGNNIEYYYDFTGALVEMKDDLGRFYTFTYTDTLLGKRLTNISDFKDYKFNLVYDQLTGDLLSVSLNDGGTVNYEYELLNEKLLLKNIDDFIQLDYSNDKVSEVITGDAADVNEQIKDTFTYPSSISCTHTDSNTVSTSYTYSETSSFITYGSKSGTSGAQRSNKVFTDNFMTERLTIDNLSKNYTYENSASESDRRGDNRVASIVDFDGTSEAFIYETFAKPNYGRIKEHISKINVSTTYEYKSTGGVYTPLSESYTASYPDANGHTLQTTTTLNSNGQLLSVSTPTKSTVYSYYVSDEHFKEKDDREGYLYSIVTNNFRTNLEESSEDVETSQENVEQYTGRDAYGRMISSTNMKGATTIYTYNEIGELLNVTHPPIVINNENNLNISNPEETRIYETYDYNNRGVVTSKSVENPVPVYENGSVSYEAIVTDTNYTYDKAYRLKSITTPYRINIEGTSTDLVYNYFYDNNGKGSRVKAVEKPTGGFDLTLIDDAGRVKFEVRDSTTADLNEGSAIPDLSLATYYEYNSKDQLFSKKVRFGGDSLNAGGEEIEHYTYEFLDLKTHTTENPKRIKTYYYNTDNQGRQLVRTKVEDENFTVLEEIEKQYYTQDGSLKSEKNLNTDISTNYEYKPSSNFVREVKSNTDGQLSRKNIWYGSQGQEIASDILFTHPSNAGVSTSQLMVNLYDDHNQLLTSETIYNKSKATKDIQADLKEQKNYHKNIYSATDHVIGKELPLNIARTADKSKIKIYPSAFGQGIIIDQEGKVDALTYNELGEVLQVAESLDKSQPRYTNYEYTISGYNKHGLAALGASKSVLQYRTDSQTQASIAREEVYNRQGKMIATVDYNDYGKNSETHKKTVTTFDERLRTKTITDKAGNTVEYVYYPAVNGTASNDSYKLQYIRDADNPGRIYRHFKNYNIFGKAEEVDEYNYHDTDGSSTEDLLTIVTLVRDYSELKESYGKITSEQTMISRKNINPDSSMELIYDRTIQNEFYKNGPREKLIYPELDYTHYIYKGQLVQRVALGDEGENPATAKELYLTDYTADDSSFDLRHPSEITLGGKSTVKYSFKNNDRRWGQIDKITLQPKAGDPFQNVVSYEYDTYLKKKSKVQWDNSTQTFDYDDFERLKVATSTDENFFKSDTFVLDDFENLKSTFSIISDAGITLTQGELNQYNSFNPYTNLREASGAEPGTYNAVNFQQSMQYDDRGNLKFDSNFKYNWDIFGRLNGLENQYTVNSVTPKKVFHIYDALGRRVNTLYRDSNNQHFSDRIDINPETNQPYAVSPKWLDRYYLYDGLNLIEEYTAYQEPVTGVVSNTRLKRYYYGTEHSPIGVDIGGHTGEVYYFIKDELGNITGTVRLGEIIEKFFYNSTGLMNVEYNGSRYKRSQIHDFGWAGMFKDPYTGHYHTRYREFDPVMNRWLSQDPAGMVDGMNLYANYFGVNSVDPEGRFAFVPLLIFAAGMALDYYFHDKYESDYSFGWSLVKNAVLTFGTAGVGHLAKGAKGLKFAGLITAEAAMDIGAGATWDVYMQKQSVGNALISNSIFFGIGSSLGGSINRVMKHSVDVRPGSAGSNAFEIARSRNLNADLTPTSRLPSVTSTPIRFTEAGQIQAKVPVIVNGKNGKYLSHRWKNKGLSEVDRLRAEFNSSGRSNFLKAFAKGSDGLADMRADFITALGNESNGILRAFARGNLPRGWDIHHIEPLARGGDNAFRNLIPIRRPFHQDQTQTLHNYYNGFNPRYNIPWIKVNGWF